MGYLIINKDSDSDEMRHGMRRMMRGDYRYDGMRPMMHHGDGDWEHAYRMGYKHGYEDHEDDMREEEHYRRARDSRGRYI